MRFCSSSFDELAFDAACDLVIFTNWLCCIESVERDCSKTRADTCLHRRFHRLGRRMQDTDTPKMSVSFSVEELKDSILAQVTRVRLFTKFGTTRIPRSLDFL